MLGELVKVRFLGIETWSQDYRVKLRSQVMRASCLGGKKGMSAKE